MSQPEAASISRSQAIIAFALGTLFFSYAFVQRVSPSVMTDELMREFAVGGAALGSLSAFYFYAYASIQLPVGMLTDRFGPRKLMSFTAALCALASIGFALSDSLLTASVGRALIGGTVAFAFVGTLAIAGYWFKPAQYALLAGLLQTAGMCGGIFGQAPLRQLVESIGWRSTINVLAVVALALALLLFLLVPKRSSEQKQHGPRPGIMQGLRAVAINPQTWICSIIGFGMASSMLALGGLWAVPWLNSIHGYSKTEAAAVSSMIFVGWAIFSPLCGWLSDRIGRRNIILQVGVIIVLIALSALIYATPQNTSLLMLLMFIVGAGGSAMTVCFGSVRELNDLNYSSTSLGLMNMCIVGSGAVMQPLIGWLLDLGWSGETVDGARIYSASGYTTPLSACWRSTWRHSSPACFYARPDANRLTRFTRREKYMQTRWMLLGLLMLGVSLPVTAEEISLELKVGKPGAAEFRLAAIRAFYKRNYKIWSIDPTRVTGRYRDGAKLEVILQDSAVVIRNATRDLLSSKNARRYLNNLRRDLIYELAAYMITAPSSGELTDTTSIRAPTVPTESGTAVSGTYASRITSDSQYTFQKKSSRNIAITLVQDGNNITGTNREYDLKLIGTREGNRINFYTLPSKITTGEIEGEWEVSDDARTLTGKWTRGGASGIWNLAR